MAARRYTYPSREDEPEFRIYVDDETPISEFPVEFIVSGPNGGSAYFEFTIDEAEKVLAGLTRAIEDARTFKRLESAR